MTAATSTHPQAEEAPHNDVRPIEDLIVEDLVVEEVSIDGMCGVY